MATDEKEDQYLRITQQLEDIHSILKQTYEAFIHFQETDEFISDDGLLLEEGLAKERDEQELEHETMRNAIRQKTRKERQQNRARILRKARSVVAEQNKNSQVWDSSLSQIQNPKLNADL
jgi:hypothetical protein